MKSSRIAILSAMVIIILTACNIPVQQPQMNVETSVAKTLEALNSDTLPINPTSILNTIAPETPQPALPTNTLLPTLTPYPTYTPYPTATKIPCNQASWVSETIVDETHFPVGSTFTKTWTVTNSGTCTWTTNYKVIFDHGDALGGPASFNLPAAIAPGQNYVISVDLKAPATAGTYQGYWKLQDNNGNPFGLAPSNKTFWVKIIADAAAFTIKSAQVTTPHVHVEAACPYTFTFQANIVSTAAGTAKVWWVFSDSSTTAPQDITFPSASTISLTTTWSLGSSYSGWVAIANDYPNHQVFDLQRANFELVCTP